VCPSVLLMASVPSSVVYGFAVGAAVDPCVG